MVKTTTSSTLSAIGVLIVGLCAISLLPAGTDAKRHGPLLVEDEGARRNRPAECLFGKTLRELGSTWFADLGPPFGVMYCIKCECVAVHKKRRIVARVQCRNIKNECPKPTCDEPILLPGRCCKSCPGDAHSPDIVQDLPQAQPDEEERSKHFAALLTGRTSSILKRDDIRSTYSTINPQNIVATGRFVFHKKNLYYSFYISDKAPRPRAIQFVDNQGNILEEHPLVIPPEGPFSVYQNATGKICGVWRRVPRDYRRLLRDDMMNVVLLWGGKYQAELAIAGPIGKYPALPQELFSSLLEPAPGTNPEQMNGAGGTAIVSTKSGVTSSIYLTIVLNGIFSPDDIADVPLNIRLEMQNKDQVILEETQRVKKPAHDINIIEMSSPLSVNDLRLLTRGKLTVVVESKRKPEALRIQGIVQTRVACEVFQTLLTSHNPESRTDTTGLSWMYLNKEGSLVYNIQTHNLHMNYNPVITLIDDSAKRKAEIENLGFSSEHVSGVVDRMGPRVLEPLYSGDLAINVANDLNLNLVHGKYVSRPVADARDSTAPVLLKRVSNSAAPPHSVGMAWVAVDNECNLHYEVTLAGVPHHSPWTLFLEELPIEAPNAPISRTPLEDFSGNYLEGFVLAMPSIELAKLETSVIYLELRSKSKDEPILKAKLKSIKVPNHCTGNQYHDNDVQNNSVISTPHNDNNLPSGETKCYHSSRFYDEGDMWNVAEQCTMCSCFHRRVKCEPIKCPPLKCRKEDIVQKKGDCCPTCAVSRYPEDTSVAVVSKPRGCHLGDHFHSAGSTWHPYLPPNGYDTCIVCTCDAHSLEINCPRTQCPPLNCSDKVAYRPDKKACCKVCPQVIKSKPSASGSPGEMGDQAGSSVGTLRNPQTILANGGCSYNANVYENGQEFHPVLATHGEQKCVKCSCKDGHIKCERKRCARSVCARQHLGARKNAIAADECCQCPKTAGRHQQHRRRQQQQQNQKQTTAISVKS